MAMSNTNQAKYKDALMGKLDEEINRLEDAVPEQDAVTAAGAGGG